jgi:hypothetical protein
LSGSVRVGSEENVGSLPFTAYDFFAYLAEGFVFLLSIQAGFVGNPGEVHLGTTEGLALIAAAYVVGQLIGQLAGGLLETGLFDKTTVGFPSVNLLVERNQKGFVKACLFNAYWRKFPPAIRLKILHKARDLKLEELRTTQSYPGHFRLKRCDDDWRKLAEHAEALYDHCFGALKAREIDSGRLANLLNVYTFCRNMSIALVLGAGALLAASLFLHADTGDKIGPGWWVAGALVTAVGLFMRYLKMFRLFHEEIFTTYAELPQGPDGNGKR